MTAWYNENDKAAAAWLQVLMSEGHIAPGVIDTRSIKDVQPDDLRGFTQCHFFAGIGTFSHALRANGWDDDRPIWTGSCPCGPFSDAGLKKGFEDDRHLWPDWFRLVGQCRPDRLLGEQVASAGAWLDLVSSDLEGQGYAFAAPDLCAAGFGGAHIRQRLFWVADADNAEWWSERAPGNVGDWPQAGRVQGDSDARYGGADDGMGHNRSPRLERGDARALGLQCSPPERTGGLGWLVDADRIPGVEGGSIIRGRFAGGDAKPWTGPSGTGDADWLWCRDSTWRPVEPGTCPLVDEAPARMGRLRGYGNGIDAQAAINFVGAYMDCLP